ncbi:CotH kinase family protein [Phytohabitans kaempferiae]|uniref:CotH kinase family protein n=1 Tax=Phytohabitans kaempferiae TaxID=1620943 RepID=A0ABV6LVF8_9ACTN
MRTAVRSVAVVAMAILVAGITLPARAGTSRAAPDAPPAAPAVSAADAAAQAEAQADLTGDITFSVPSGTFQGQVSVGLSTAVSGAQIRYTTNGQPPTASSPLYSAPLRLTATTQLRAQAFVSGAASGEPGTALYIARSINANHDLPLVVVDAYGAGRPGREYVDAATMVFGASAGAATSLSATPAVATRAGVRLRGQSSSTFEKTPYRLEFWDNENDDLDWPVLGMPADSDWVMRGPFTDKALIRDAFVYGLGRDMGIHAPRFAFVEFYLNTDASPLAANDYMGVYMIVETIKNSKDRLDLKQLDEEDTTLPRIQGGYIFKFEWMAAEEPILECTGAASSCWNYLEVEDPSPLNAQQEAWLTQHLQQFHNLLDSPGYADPNTGYPAWIDVPSFINQLIIYELSREMDAYVRSAYFHKDREGKIVAGPLWDYDLSFGVGGFFNNTQTSGWQHQQTRQPMANDWFQTLLRDPAFVNQVRNRWRELRQGLLSNASLNARIDGLATPLTNAAQRNFQRWPNLTSPTIGFFNTPTAPTWQGQVQVMRDWLAQRVSWLDSTSGWGGGTTPPTSPPPTTAPPPTTPPPSTPPPAGRSCTATYSVTSQWTGGFQADVRVTAGSAPISGWTVTWTFGNGQSVSQSWNATVTASGTSVTARNVSYNGSLGAGASTAFGFLGSWNSTNPVPSLTCTAT